MKKIKSYEEACEILKRDPKALPDVSMLPEQQQKFVLASIKLDTIAEAINGDWKPDWNNSNQYKYYPWFVWSGSGFSYDGFDGGRTHSCVGSRLCFKSREVAEYMGETFIELYNDFMQKP